MNPEAILGSLIRGALLGSGKSSQGALRYLTGGRGSFLTASTVLAAAGVAWGLYEAARQPPSAPAASLPSAGGGVPPLPAPPLPDDLLRLVRLAISAARADGDLSLTERGLILEHARQAGAEALLAPELQNPRPLGEIVAGVTDPGHRAEMYTLAYVVVHADEGVSGAERIYLAQLAHFLGLDPAATSRLEAEADAGVAAAAGAR